VSDSKTNQERPGTVACLVATRVVKTTHVRGLRANGWESHLKLVENTKGLVELGINMWHVCSECVFLRTAVVALQFRSASL